MTDALDVLAKALIDIERGKPEVAAHRIRTFLDLITKRDQGK